MAEMVPPSNEGVSIPSPEVLENPDMEVGGDITGAGNVHG